jgi:hypothetical protein
MLFAPFCVFEKRLNATCCTREAEQESGHADRTATNSSRNMSSKLAIEIFDHHGHQIYSSVRKLCGHLRCF